MPAPDYTNVNQEDPLGKGVAGYTPKTVQLDESKDTVAGRLNTFLAEDNPMLQQARTYAKQQANKSGRLNTSMTDGAVFGAMMDRALPVAQQDAQTSFNAKTFNTDSQNQGGQFNANQQNTIASQLAGQNFQSKENQLDRTHQENLQTREQTWRTGEAANDRAHDLTVQDRDRLMREALQDDQQTFERAQNQLQLEIQNRQLETSQSNIILASQQDTINAVLLDPELSPEAKRVAILNIQNGSRETVEFIDYLNKSTGAPSGNTGTTTNPSNTPAPAPGNNYGMNQSAYTASIQMIQSILNSNKTDAQKVDDAADLIKAYNLPLQLIADQVGTSVDRVQNAYSKRYPNG